MNSYQILFWVIILISTCCCRQVTGHVCGESMPRNLPAGYLLFSVSFPTKYAGRADYYCETGLSSDGSGEIGSERIVNKCNNGYWKFQEGRFPECKPRSMCKGKFFVELPDNRCYVWVPSMLPNHERCKTLGGGLGAVAGNMRTDEDMNKLKTALDSELSLTGHLKGKPALIYVALTRTGTEMSWSTRWKWDTNNRTINTYQPVWMIGYPRSNTPGDIRNQAAIHWPSMSFMNPGLEEIRDVDSQVYTLCEIFGRNYTTSTGLSEATPRINVLKEGETFTLGIKGVVFDEAVLRDVQYPLQYRSQYVDEFWAMDSVTNKLSPDQVREEWEQKWSERVRLIAENEDNPDGFPRVNFVVSKQFDQRRTGTQHVALKCGKFLNDVNSPMRRVAIWLEQSNRLKGPTREDEDGPEKFCTTQTDGRVVATIEEAASNRSTGQWILSDVFNTGLNERVNNFVIGANGWSQWTKWSHCSLPGRNTERMRVCGRAFRPDDFPVDCGGRMSDVQETPCLGLVNPPFTPPPRVDGWWSPRPYPDELPTTTTTTTTTTTLPTTITAKTTATTTTRQSATTVAQTTITSPDETDYSADTDYDDDQDSDYDEQLDYDGEDVDNVKPAWKPGSDEESVVDGRDVSDAQTDYDYNENYGGSVGPNKVTVNVNKSGASVSNTAKYLRFVVFLSVTLVMNY